MKKEGFVSFWVGTTKSEKDLDEFMKTTYDEDGNYVKPHFAKKFDIRRFDEDFREVKFYEQSLKSLEDISKGFSYYDIIIPKFMKFVNNNFPSSFNAVILLYNFDYSGTKEYYNDGINNFQYIGSVEYKNDL